MTFHAPRMRAAAHDDAHAQMLPAKTQRPYHLFDPFHAEDDEFQPSGGLMRADRRMLTTLPARMAVITTALLLAALLGEMPTRARVVPPRDRPIDVRFQLADGIRISGQMTACDEDGFDGSFGRREWIDLHFDDTWKLHQRVMNASSAHDWLNLGRVMLLMSEAQPLAKTRADMAFRRARQIDGAISEEIERVRQDVAAIHRAQRDARREAITQQLRTLSPEAGPSITIDDASGKAVATGWPATLWPELSADERAAAVRTMKADADSVLESQRAAIVPAETANFIIYSDLERARVADWAVRLERTCTALHVVLNPGINPHAQQKPATIQPWGKIVVFIWKQHDQFKMVEAGTFGQLVPNSAVAITHYSGPRTFINSWRIDDDEAFEWALLRETVHALMHRFGSPRRLPAWANTGLAELVASRMNKQSLVGGDRRRHALEFLRSGGNVNAVLDLKYEDGTFPGPDDLGATVGGLVVELMHIEKPVPFVQWIVAIKRGKDWALALREHYGSPRENVVEIATQYYRVNN